MAAAPWGWAVVLGSAVTAAQPTPDSPARPAPARPAPAAPVPAAPTAVTPAPASAIETVARGIVAAMKGAPAGLVVSSQPLESDEPAPKGEELRGQLLRLVAGKLGGLVHEGDDPRAAAQDALGYLVLTPRIAGGRLRLSADAFAVPQTVWAKARQPAPHPIRHAQAQAPVDAEVRTFLEPLAFAAKPEVAKYRGADPDLLAIACGDLDADGRNDLVTVTRGRVLRVTLADGKVTRLAEAAWADLGPIAPVPLRQPLAFATIVEGPTTSHPRGYLDVSLTDRMGSRRLDPDLAVLARMEGKAVPHGARSACTWTFQLRLGEKVRACQPGDGAPVVGELKRRADAMASMRLVSPEGQGRDVVALRDRGTLLLRDAAGEQRLARVGAQVAIADLDQDGAPEVVTTVDTLARRFDAVDVRTVGERGKLERRYRVRVPSGVEALAACPADGQGPGQVVVGTAEELWTLR